MKGKEILRWSFLFGFALFAMPAFAGIAFHEMPVGCSWTVKYSDGQTNTEIFLGKESGKYVTKVVDSKNREILVRHSLYDNKGRLVQKNWANGKWEKFSPFSCFDSPESCTYTYSNADGVIQEIASKTKSSGKGFKVKAGPIGGKSYPEEYFEVGQFGVLTTNKAKNYSARVLGFDNCG